MTDKTDKKDSPATDPNGPAEPAVAKRPHATLDLRAIEVRDQPAARSEAAVKIETPGQAKSSEGTAGDSKPARSPDAKPATGDGKTSATRPAEGSPMTPPSRNPSALGRFASHFVAGVAGGLLALLSGDWLARQTGFVVGNASLHDSATALQRRVTALEQAASEAGSDDVVARFAATDEKLSKIEALSSDIVALRDQQSGLAADTKALTGRLDQQSASTETADRLTKLEGQLSSLVAAAGEQGISGGTIPQLAAITGKFSDLETTLTGQIETLRKTLPQDLESRLGSLSEGNETAKSTATRIDRELTSIKTDAARLTQRIETLKADGERFGQSLQVIQEETGKLTSSVNDVRSTVESQSKAFVKTGDIESTVAPVTGRLAELEQNLTSVIKSEAERRANAERIITSLELANLKRVVERGQAYSAELDAVRAVSGGRIELAALDQHKATGVPSLADLQHDSRDAIKSMLDAGAHAKDGTLLDQFLAGAQTVVRVRKAEYSPDDASPEAAVARMEKQLSAGRLGGVLSEAGKLSPDAQAAAKDWLSKIEARHTIDAAIASLEQQLKSSLTSGAAAGPVPSEPAQAPKQEP